MALLTALRLRSSLTPCVLRLHGSAGPLLARKFARATAIARPARIKRIARASCARHWHYPRDAVATRALVSVARLWQRGPPPLRAVAVFSSRRYCLRKVVHSVRPNYSFKATAMCRGDNPAPGAAP